MTSPLAPIPPHSRWRILRGPRANQILLVGGIASTRHPSPHLAEYWATNETTRARRKVKAWALEDHCERLAGEEES
jgi:hypothetical protein